MPLTELPIVERLTLARVTKVPEWHPEHARFEPFPVHAWVVRHPEGAILFDTGIGDSNAAINDWYAPEIVRLDAALARLRITPRDIVTVVLSHMHYDHCGQQQALDAPLFVQAAEHEEAQHPGYTVPEWSNISAHRLRVVDGDEEIADGIHLLATPGHTPGHQSMLIEAEAGRIVLGAQCAFSASEVRSGEPSPTNLHGESWGDAARDSLERVRALAPATVQLSHDTEVVRLS